MCIQLIVGGTIVDMGKTLAYKILEQHLVEGSMIPGEEIKIKIDQTLTQDSTGTMVYLQLEAMDVDKIQTELSVAYIDHNTLQKTQMTTSSSRALQSATAFCSQSRATASAISFTLRISAFREKPCWALTATRLPAAVSV